MNFKPETIKYKQAILDLLKHKSYSFDELKTLLNLEKNIINNYLTGLKKNNMIQMININSGEKNKRRKYVLFTDKTLSEVMLENQDKVSAGVRKHFEKTARVKEAQAKGIYVNSCNDYHTQGNKSKISSWHGYSSF